MSDQTSNTPHLARHSKAPTAEYWFYFGVILMATLPIAAAGFLIALVTCDREAARKGILHKAWSQAQTLTSLIFSA
jgi:hypothetical protein